MTPEFGLGTQLIPRALLSLCDGVSLPHPDRHFLHLNIQQLQQDPQSQGGNDPNGLGPIPAGHLLSPTFCAVSLPGGSSDQDPLPNQTLEAFFVFPGSSLGTTQSSIAYGLRGTQAGSPMNTLQLPTFTPRFHLARSLSNQTPCCVSSPAWM